MGNYDKPLYTVPDGGVQKYGGWNKAGRKRYREIKQLVKVGKGEYYNKDKKLVRKKQRIEKVMEIEKAALARIREAHGIEEDSSKRRRKNPAAKSEPEVDSDHEPDWY